jgi:hypothetical protein
MARALRLRRPSPALVVACLALFVALSGFGYAATQLPRNSVGAAQLRNGSVVAQKIKKGAVVRTKLATGAVSSAKIANGEVTGADVDEATLGQVPSATNSSSVGGLAPSAFARADRFYTGSGDTGANPAQTLFSIPAAVRVETDGDADASFEIAVTNLSADRWDISSDAGATISSITPNGRVLLSSTNAVITYVMRDAVQTERYLMVTCGNDASPVNRLECFAVVSDAL